MWNNTPIFLLETHFNLTSPSTSTVWSLYKDFGGRHQEQRQQSPAHVQMQSKAEITKNGFVISAKKLI